MLKDDDKYNRFPYKITEPKPETDEEKEFSKVTTDTTALHRIMAHYTKKLNDVFTKEELDKWYEGISNSLNRMK